MPQSLKRNAIIVCGLAIVFWWSFMFAKHDMHLRNIIPFGDDPYDAIGSFGIIVGILIALLSVVRAFRPYPDHPPTMAQRLYLVRSQEAVVLAVFLTILADAVAMVRHPSIWISAPSRRELIVLLGGLSFLALCVQWLIKSSQRRLTNTRSVLWSRVVFSVLLAALVLAIYPEQLIQRVDTHLLTVVIADFILFATMRVLLTSLVPYKRDEGSAHAGTKGSGLLTVRYRWGLVVVLGVLIGAFAFLAEMSEGGGSIPLVRVLFVSSVFGGLGLAGLLIAYAGLGTPLGLGARS